MSEEAGTPRDKRWLQEMCELVEAKLPENYGFVVFGFPTTGTDRCYYASNCQRAPVIEALRQWIADSDAILGKHHK